MKRDTLLISFYLPQFHPIPENDEWWGKGFTEWTNVTKAKPLFPGHYQPHLPADLGFYDLRLPETREAQANLARDYGIHGFCYYHYWFNGRRILERPVNDMLALGQPDFPFCLCWANENWTRTWSGGTNDILLEQCYSPEDDLAHIQSLFPAFRDPRYIRIDGKPVFLVYRSELLPDPQKTAELWRNAAIKEGIGDLYLVRVESFSKNIDPRLIGFDAAVEFAPDGSNIGQTIFDNDLLKVLAKIGAFPKRLIDNTFIDYDTLANTMLAKPQPDYLRFPGITPSWDNSARKKRNATILTNATPDKYEEWLATIINKLHNNKDTPKLVFVNAWNEWAEGNHLEPDQKWGRAYLQATLNALNAPEMKRNALRKSTHPLMKINTLYKQYIGWRFQHLLNR